MPPNAITDNKMWYMVDDQMCAQCSNKTPKEKNECDGYRWPVS